MPHVFTPERQVCVVPGLQEALHKLLDGTVAIQGPSDVPLLEHVRVPTLVMPQEFAAEIQDWVVPGVHMPPVQVLLADGVLALQAPHVPLLLHVCVPEFVAPQEFAAEIQV